VLYEKYNNNSNSQKPVTQKSLFPTTIELSVADAVLMEDLLPEFAAIGFEIEHFGANSFIIQGTPADVLHINEKHSIDLLLEQYKYFNSDFKFSKREKLIRCLAKQHALKEGTSLNAKEIQTLLDALFACTINNATANGLPTFIEFKEDYLAKLFGR
jgi:DNA mismatch repair protein MutL